MLQDFHGCGGKPTEIKNRMENIFAEVHSRIHAFMHESLDGKPAESFNQLALELCRLQRKANPAYAKLCAARSVPEIIDWRQIPAVPTVAFKELELTSLPQDKRERVFFSSGTTQQDRSRHFHSRSSLGLYDESLQLWFKHNFRNRCENVQWLFLTPPGTEAAHSSLAHMFETLAANAANSEFHFLGVIGADGGWELDTARLMARLLWTVS